MTGKRSLTGVGSADLRCPDTGPRGPSSWSGGGTQGRPSRSDVADRRAALPRLLSRQRSRSDEYEISGADILEVITWADAHTLERTYVLYTCVPGDGLGLICLAGTDPNQERGITWDFTVPDR